MEVRHVALPGVVDQQISRAKARLHRIRKGLNLVGVQHVAAVRKNLPVGEFVLQRRMGAGEPIRVTAAEGDFRPFTQQQAQRFKANARRTAGDYRYAPVNLCIHRAPLR
ncbi:Uncharacterised protein [Enterobacter hormaechei]|nr:Uncharacterised protein [Enterobacter hormaechei]SAA57090.1 Uncharacterised protein [Enterobacter hormaechei]SAA60570.1 Uncharacterised protein [Enterobacter hormaechei]SAB91904.1 Uncharacterised protein [Enterobacter hormaechei]SAG48725.1 Uncharacterised protein [Enterobacter hormaechei]